MHIDSQFPEAVAAFFAGGGRITKCPDFQPQPKPARSSRIDPDTKLTRAPKPQPIELRALLEPARAPQHKETPQEIETVRQYAEAGMSQTDCARALGCDSKQVFRIAKRHGITFTSRSKARPKTDAEIAEIIRPLIIAGATFGEMRTAAGCRRERLHKVINEHCREQVYARKHQPA